MTLADARLTLTSSHCSLRVSTKLCILTYMERSKGDDTEMERTVVQTLEEVWRMGKECPVSVCSLMRNGILRSTA